MNLYSPIVELEYRIRQISSIEGSDIKGGDIKDGLVDIAE